MNLAPVLDAAVSLVSVVVTAAVPILVSYAVQRFKIGISADQETSLENTITTALGKALQYGEEVGDPALQNVTLKNAALNTAVSFALQDAPVALKALGYDQNSIAEVISARLKLLLDGKPTVVAQPVPAPTPAAVETAAALEKVTPQNLPVMEAHP